MIRENELLVAVATYVEKDLSPIIPDDNGKTAAMAFVLAAGLTPAFVLRLIKRKFPIISTVIEDNGMVDIESVSILATEWIKRQKTFSISIPYVISFDIDQGELAKIIKYAKQYEKEEEADEE